MRPGLYVALALLLACLARAYAPLRFSPPPPAAETFRGPSGWDAAGAVHVHTAASDGSGTQAEILAAARRADCDFVLLADHHRVQQPLAQTDLVEGGVTLMAGLEIDTDRGHLVAAGLADLDYHPGPEAEDAAAEILRLGSPCWVAHADAPDFGWSEPLPARAEGLELLNLASQWYNASTAARLWAFTVFPLNGRFAILEALRRPRHNLRLWSAAGRDRAALAAADAHGPLKVLGRYAVGFPNYADQLAVAKTHLLLDRPLGSDAARNRGLILDALHARRSFAALDGLASARGFDFWADLAGQIVPQGARVLAPGLVLLKALNPKPGEAVLKLLRSGEPIATSGSRELQAVTNRPGRYWVEGYLERSAPARADVPWIVSAAIELAESDSAPAAEPAVERIRTLDTGSIRAEHDPRSWIEDAAVTQSREGGLRHRLEFRLAGFDPAHPEFWCALALRRPDNFADASQIAFRTGADRRLRLTFQLRTASGSGERQWERNFFSGVAATEVRIRFADLRPSGAAGERPALDQVTGIFIIASDGNTRGGTRASAWFEDFRLERPAAAR